MRNMRILTVGLQSEIRKAILSKFQNCREICVTNSADLRQWLNKDEQENPYHAVIAGHEIDVTPVELAQIIRMKLPTTPTVFVDIDGFGQQNELKKNGFDNVFRLPAQTSAFEVRINQIQSEYSETLKEEHWVPVDLSEIDANTELEFGLAIHLKKNDKIILCARKGDKFDQDRLDRLRTKGLHEILVPKHELQAFHAYTARRLYDLSRPGRFGDEQKRRTQLHRAVRELIRGIFKQNDSQSIREDSSKAIVSQFLQRSSPPPWFTEILLPSETRNPTDAKSRLNLSATLAGLFAIALELETVPHVVTATIFHHLGLAELPSEVANGVNLSGENLQIWQRHPQLSVRILASRWPNAPQTTIQAIEQHHEEWEGTGFPAGLKGDAICIEAHIVALASHLADVAGTGTTNPVEELKRILIQNKIRPSLITNLIQILDETGSN